jgi:hypothetical protein
VSTRSAGWLLFAVFAFTVPLPAIGPFGGFAPAVHHAALFAATAAVAGAEGAAGPVGRILALFAVNAFLALALCGLAAWLVARLLGALPPCTRARIAVAACAALLAVSIAFRFYETPFGRAPTANLFGVFG